MSETNELLPCPWCGSSVRLVEFDGGAYVLCEHDGCDVSPESWARDDRATAIRAWNTRAPSPETEQLRARLSELDAVARALKGAA